MTTIKQRIRMFAQWATAIGDIPSTLSLKSIAHGDHKTWVVTVDNFKNSHEQIKVFIVESGNGKYQIKSCKNVVLWFGVPTDINFNLAMQSALDELNN